MAELVTYERSGRRARIRMNDGKVNVMNAAMLSALHGAFDRAAADNAVAILSGRDTMFSAGFDVKVIGSGVIEDIRTMLALGLKAIEGCSIVAIGVSCNAAAKSSGLMLS
jgi:enoyl-CoA hydratase